MLSTRTQLSAIGLDIDAHQFRAVQLIRSGDELTTLAWAIFPRQDSMSLKERLPDVDELKWASSILGRRGFVGNTVSIAPRTGSCSSHVIELPPPESGAPLEQLARMEIARERRCGPDEFELGLWQLPPKGKIQESLAVACPRVEIESIIERFEDAGFVPAGVDILELAVCRASSGAGVENEINASLNIGWSSSMAVLTLGGTVVYTRRFEIGASSVWEQLIGRYRLSGESAESVFNQFDKGEVSDAMKKIRRSVWTKVASEIAAELDVAVAYVSHLFRMAPLGEVRLSGYGATSWKVEDSIHELIGMTVVTNTPIVLKDSMGGREDAAAISSQLVGAFGLAGRFDR